jgi:hypothetical protein
MQYGYNGIFVDSVYNENNNTSITTKNISNKIAPMSTDLLVGTEA